MYLHNSHLHFKISKDDSRARNLLFQVSRHSEFEILHVYISFRVFLAPAITLQDTVFSRRKLYFFMQVRNEFYKDTQGALLVFDVACRSTFDCLGDWLIEMRSHLPQPSNMDNVIFAVCANKVSTLLFSISEFDWYICTCTCDYYFNPFQTDTGCREVTESEGRLWAETKGFLYFETSAKTGHNVVEMFQVCTLCIPNTNTVRLLCLRVHMYTQLYCVA